MNKKYILVIVVALAILILVAYISSIRTYSAIYCQGSVTAVTYDFIDGDYVMTDSITNSYSNTTPYSEYLWEGNIEIQEFLTMIGLPYDKIKTVYESCSNNDCEGEYILYIGEETLRLYLNTKEEKTTQDTKKYNGHLILENPFISKIDVKLVGYCIRK